MKKTSSKSQYVIVGNTKNVECICAIQTLKDGTRIIKICKVQHEELDGWHYHAFLVQSVSVNYCDMEYDGVVEFGNVKKFVLDGQDIEPSLNRTLMDMISYRRGTAWTEGMSKLLKEIENDVKNDEKTENVVKEDEQNTENVVKEDEQNTENVVRETEQKTENAEKHAKLVLTKAVKVDTFNRMCEKAWADSGLKDESIRKKVYDETAEWYKLDSKSPLAGYDKHHRPQSQEELEKQMYEDFDMQFSQYDKDMEEQDMEQDMEQIVKDEELKEAEWEYFEDETGDSPYVEATATINGYEVTVGYLWDEQEGGCYVHVNGADVEDRGFCDHCCEVVEKAIGKRLTGLSYELWESWVEYHGLHEGWEDMDDDERHELYCKAIVRC